MYVYLGPGSKVVRHAFQTATESVWGERVACGATNFEKD